MTHKPGRDDPTEAIPDLPLGSKRRKNAQEPVTTSFGLEKRAGWRVSRRKATLINLERRARFARIETA